MSTPSGYNMPDSPAHRTTDGVDLLQGTMTMTNEFEIKDSGERAEFESGMVRDTEKGKPRFDLLFPIGIPFQQQLLTRFATHMAKGAEKYTERNWERANGEAEMARYKSSAFRHLMQWLCGECDEDHAAAVMFNLMAYETTKLKVAERKAMPPTVEADTAARVKDYWKRLENAGI